MSMGEANNERTIYVRLLNIRLNIRANVKMRHTKNTCFEMCEGGQSKIYTYRYLYLLIGSQLC